MSLTGFDSEAIGFDSVSPDSRPSQSSSSQTTEFGETSAGCQASMSRDVGCGVNPEELVAEEQVLKEYPPPGLNEFLRRVVPSMMEQLDQNDKELLTSSSDSDEEDVLTAKLLQEIKVKPDGSGDHQTSVLDISWSSAGNSMAVSVGRAQHDAWCQDTGVIRVYTLKRSEDRFVHTMDITDKNCVTVLKYHPTVAALLAYGTTSGEVVVCDLRNGDLGEGARLTSAGACHGSRRVSALQWADAPAANAFLTMLVSSKGVRRRAADQVVVTAGCGGSLAAWRVNASARALDAIVGYAVRAAPDITCFDFVKPSPLRPAREKTPEDVFVVGSTTGKLFLCKIRPPQAGEVSAAVDPVYDALEGHAMCVLGVAFSAQTPGVFASVSMDSELRVYDIVQGAPLKVVWLEVAVSCVSWAWPPCLLVGLCGCEELLRVYHACGARALSVRGLCGRGDVCCLAVQQGGSCRVAAGDVCGTVRVWELPARRVKLSAQDFDF